MSLRIITLIKSPDGMLVVTGCDKAALDAGNTVFALPGLPII